MEQTGKSDGIFCIRLCMLKLRWPVAHHFVGWEEPRWESQHMMFTVPDLKNLSMAVQELSAKERRAISAMLHRRQPDFCEIIDWVGIDPRRAQAHWFCTMFCALAFRHAERASGCKLPRYVGDSIQEAAGFIARGEVAQIGRRACGYRKRILRHVLIKSDFDDDDTQWL